MAENGNFAEGLATGMATERGGYGYGYGYPMMPMAPVYYGGYGNNNNSWGDWIWIIVLFALFGNGGFGGMGGNMGAFPWLLQGQTNTDNNVNAGFTNAALSGKLDSISNQLCNNEINSLQTAYENQIAGMTQNFAMQQAFDKCCCENRLGTADLKATVISENCADREALSNGIRDIIASQTAGTQRILDQLCADKIDAKNEKIVELQNKLNIADFRASQIDQTAQIRAGFVQANTDLYNLLSNCPVPSTPVYGRQPIFTCPNNGCGCNGNNGNFAI